MNGLCFQVETMAKVCFWYHGDVALRTAWLVLLALGACARSRPPSTEPWMPASAPDLGSVIARVEGIPIYAEQVLARAKLGQTGARQALTQLLDDAALAEAGHRLGRALPSPEDADVESALVERFVEREIEPALRRSAMPDSALRPLYEMARDNFVHPRLVDVGVLAIYTGPAMAETPRQKRAQTAADLAAYLAKHPVATLDDFAAVARDSQWSSRSVVYNRILQGPDKPLSRAIGKEVAKLRAPGDTTTLLSDQNGFFVIRYIGEKPAENTSFESARPGLATRFFERWRQDRFLSLSSDLMRDHKVEAHFDRVGAETSP